MWLVWLKATKFGQRPATLLGIDPAASPLLANSVDNSVLLFGTWVESKLAETRGGKGEDAHQPRYRLEDLLADPPGPGERRRRPAGGSWQQTRRYRSPRELAGFPG